MPTLHVLKLDFLQMHGLQANEARLKSRYSAYKVLQLELRFFLCFSSVFIAMAEGISSGNAH